MSDYEIIVNKARACGAQVTQHEVGFSHAEFEAFVATLSHPATQAGAVQAAGFIEPSWTDEPPDWCDPQQEEIWNAGYDSAMSSCRAAAMQPSAAPGDGQGAMVLKPMSDKAMDMLLCPPDATTSTKRARRQIGRKVERDVLARFAAPSTATAAREQEADATPGDFGAWLLGSYKGHTINASTIGRAIAEYNDECDASRPEAPAAPSAEEEAPPVMVLAKRLYAEHPVYRKDKPLDWYSAPKAVRREWLDKARSLRSAQPIASDPQPIAGGISSKEDGNG